VYNRKRKKMQEKENIFYPSDKNLSKHIEYYWQVDDVKNTFNNSTAIYSYPGMTPELIFPLQGFFRCNSKGKIFETDQPFISTVMFQNAVLDFTNLTSFMIIRFKSHALSSLLPFTKIDSRFLITQPLILANEVFGNDIFSLAQKLKFSLGNHRAMILDEWFFSKFNADKEGLIIDVLNQNKSIISLQELKNITNYSNSTMERFFKKETGLTPKKYLIFKRFRNCLEDIFKSENADWFDLVYGHGYYDQSHFIKEIKQFTEFTPCQLLDLPSLPNFRPTTF